MLQPGATIGILGGGQLGRMIALAAARLGLKCHIYCPDPVSPAFDVAAIATCAAYDDKGALARFAAAVDVVTYEFENVPDVAATFLSEHVGVLPGPKSLATCQDRLSEKTFLQDIGVATAEFGAVASRADLDAAIGEIGVPSILKTRRFGYDGKGQAMIRGAGDVAAAWEAVGRAPSIVECVVPFAMECSAIVARAENGTAAVYDIAANHHENHILKRTTVPAPISAAAKARAAEIGRQVADALGHVGVLAVELFVVRENGGETLFANEIAPRVHNSGHWTEDGCLVSQFEQHVRAIAGWPLGSAERFADTEMENLIGRDADQWRHILADPAARLHLYGKSEIRDGRKMGHVNRINKLS